MADQTFPDDENGHALAHMLEHGVDLSAVHKVDFELVLSDEASARQFVAQVGDDAVETLVRPPEEDDPEDVEWEVQCCVRMVPSHQGITEMEQRLDSLAVSLGGYSDGWGLMSNPDGSPAE